MTSLTLNGAGCFQRCRGAEDGEQPPRTCIMRNSMLIFKRRGNRVTPIFTTIRSLSWTCPFSPAQIKLKRANCFPGFAALPAW